MGIFSNNRHSSVANIHVEAAEGYDCELGAAIAYIEQMEESQNIFNHVIMKDFEAANAKRSGLEESTIIAIEESAAGDLLSKIISFFKKLWEKIKGIFKGFMAKFDSIFVKSNKEYVKKYRTVLAKKTNMKDFKCKYAKFKTGVLILKDPSNINKDFDINNSDTANNFDKDFDDDEKKCDYVNEFNNNLKLSSFKDLQKDFHELYFDDPEIHDDIDVHVIGAALEASDKDLTNAKKSYTVLENAIKKCITAIEKAQTEVAKTFGKDNEAAKAGYKFTISKDSSTDKSKFTDGSGDTLTDITSDQDKNKSTVMKKLQYMHKCATCFQAVATGLSACVIKAIKFKASQERKVYAAAVAYRGPKNEAAYGDLDYLDAVMEAVQYDIDTDFQAAL